MENVIPFDIEKHVANLIVFNEKTHGVKHEVNVFCIAGGFFKVYAKNDSPGNGEPLAVGTTLGNALDNFTKHIDDE